MKNLLLMLVIAFAVSTTAIAQQSNPSASGQKAWKLNKKQRHKIIKDLHLTKAQKMQWKASKAEFKGKQQAIKSNASLSEIQKKQQLKELHQERMEKIRSILTPEQLSIFQREMQQTRNP